MTQRAATRFDWRRVMPPAAYHGKGAYYLAAPTEFVALNAWQVGGYWRWGIMAFVNGLALVYRSGDAPTLGEAKLRAEQTLPPNVPPELWDYRPDDPPRPMGDHEPDEIPF